MNNSQKMTQYNKMKRLTASGDKRTDKALGILNTAVNGGETNLSKYNTTPTGCECPDRKFNKTVCKHMRAAQALVEAKPKRSIEPNLKELGF